MILVRIKKTGLLRKAWRVKITFGNNEPFPHDYNDPGAARKSLRSLFDETEPVKMVTDYGNGHTQEEMLR